MNPRVLGWRDFYSLSFEPNVADQPGSPTPYIALDTRGGIDGKQLSQVANWCQRQPLPIVTIGEVLPGILDIADIVVADDGELALVAAAIEQNPAASAVLVQVLRSTLRLPVAQALAVESLAYSVLQGGEEFHAWLGSQPKRTSKANADTEPMVLVERQDHHVEMTLNSPANRNALSVPMRDALADAFRLVALDPAIVKVDVRGNGPSFCSGGDLSEFGSSTDHAAAHATRMARMPAQFLAPCADRFTFHLKGACVGAGIEIPAFAGRIVAAPDTVLRLPEVAMGLIPGAGGCVSIPRRIGRQRTAWMAVTGLPVDARRALEWGLVDEIAR